jgi:transposase
VIAAILAQEPELLSVELLRRAKLRGYTGGKTALYTLISALRPKTIRPLVRFEGLAGEFTQHDFGHVDVRFLDRTEKRVHFFASRLKYSRWVEVTIVKDERAETLVRTFVDHFAAIGGVPLLAVFDRPKTVVGGANTDVVEPAGHAARSVGSAGITSQGLTARGLSRRRLRMRSDTSSQDMNRRSSNSDC